MKFEPKQEDQPIGIYHYATTCFLNLIYLHTYRKFTLYISRGSNESLEPT